MIAAFDTQPPPDIPEVADWLERVRRDQGLGAAQEAVFRLARRFPDQAELQHALAAEPVADRPRGEQEAGEDQHGSGQPSVGR